MTEITGKNAATLAVAILIAPGVVSLALVTLSLLLPVTAFLGLLFAYLSLHLGYLPYLLLGAPLMVAAHCCGLRHPLIHAALGYGAVQMFPVLAQWDVDLFVELLPLMSFSAVFAPLWCATAALIFQMFQREFKPLQEA